MDARKIRVAIVGGGCAGMAAAHELTRPEQGGRFEVTLYQQGWRLGGKGASGRGENARIEEHGLHIWMGFYENAFRLMRSVYAELGRDPKTCPIAAFGEAFFPSSHVGLANTADATSGVWSTILPPVPGEPGTPLGDGIENPFSIAGYAVRVGRLVRNVFDLAYGSGQTSSAGLDERWTASDLVLDAHKLAALVAGSVDTALAIAQRQLETLTALLRSWTLPVVSSAIDALATALQKTLDWVRPSKSSDPHRQRAGEVLEISLAAIVGIVRSGALLSPRGFDVLDDHDFVDWLRENGLSERAASAPFLTGLYALIFAYEGGDYARPRAAAGQMLRGVMRMFFTYRGSFFWKMTAGMGDVVFAPLYEVLRRRGVTFEFFHRLSNVRVGAGNHVAGLDFGVQADVNGDAYQPLVDVHGLPSWPSKPDWSQLVDGADHERNARSFESHWDERHVRTKSLAVGEDFDFVVLAVGGGAVRFVARELLDNAPRWRTMADHIATVATQALQIWTATPMSELGWTRGPVTVGAFVHPFDTWSDMTHLVPAEAWPASRSVHGIAYFCNVLDERDVRRCEPFDLGHQARVNGVVLETSRSFVANDLPRLWPRADAAQARDHYWVGNVNPTDRYVQSLPGNSRHRISPLDRTYDNLAIAGDWTACGLSLGCVEAAVMSGLLASNALSGAPALDAIVGYDHP